MIKIMLPIGILAVLVLSACQNEVDDTNEAEEDRKVPVEVVQASIGDLVVERSVNVRTAPAEMTPIMVTTPGEIAELYIENGDQVEEDESVASIQTRVGKQTIKAPRAGEIMQLKAKEEDLISEEDPLAMIVDLDDMIAQVGVTHTIRALLKQDMTVEALIEGETYDATITSISQLPDDTGLYPIEAMIKNDDHIILSGMIAELRIPEVREEHATIVPTEAVIEESDGDFVFIVNDDQAVKMEVSILDMQSDQTAIEGDINEGDQVVVNGQITLADGVRVNVVKEGHSS